MENSEIWDDSCYYWKLVYVDLVFVFDRKENVKCFRSGVFRGLFWKEVVV